jgi:predicted amidohydrolase
MKTALLLLCCCATAVQAAGVSSATRQDILAQSLPRKVVVATACQFFPERTDADERATIIAGLFADAVAETARLYPGVALDLFVLPEHALQKRGAPAATRALRLDDEPVRRLAALAAQHHAWLVLPLILSEDSAAGPVFSNAAVLINRSGKVAGIYRKTHPLGARDGSLENGITPGREHPVFTTDFGRVGLQICWDMSYEEGWAALAEGGAEIVALPSASPQNVRLAAYAQRFRYWIVNSTPRDNVTVFNPLGLADATRTRTGVLVHRFDLVSIAVGWTPEIADGRAFQNRFGERGGHIWNTREDAGLFWSNDPHVTVGSMLRELDAETLDAQADRIAAQISRAHPAPPVR